jgi:phosphatidylserine synthase
MLCIGSASTRFTGQRLDVDSVSFVMSRRAWLCLARVIPGVAALLASMQGRLLIAGLCLVSAVWADVIVVWIARRKGWRESVAAIQIENLTDFFCFVAVPAAFAFAVCRNQYLAFAIAMFVVCGIFRLARFQVEGLVRGGYRGLPVTYNGYIFPLMAFLLFRFPVLECMAALDGSAASGSGAHGKHVSRAGDLNCAT